MATLEETVNITIYDNGTNKYLRSETHTLTEEISGSSIVPAETLAYKTYGTTYALVNCSATISGITGPHFGLDTLTLPDDGKITLYFVNRKYVADFSWTDNDAEKIKAGEPTTNLQAEAIKRVVDLFNGDLARIWWTRSALPDVSPGDEITYGRIFPLWVNIRNTLMCVLGRDGIRPYRLNVDPKKGEAIRATKFANHEYSMKSAINKIIQYLRP